MTNAIYVTYKETPNTEDLSNKKSILITKYIDGERWVRYKDIEKYIQLYDTETRAERLLNIMKLQHFLQLPVKNKLKFIKKNKNFLAFYYEFYQTETDKIKTVINDCKEKLSLLHDNEFYDTNPDKEDLNDIEKVMNFNENGIAKKLIEYINSFIDSKKPMDFPEKTFKVDIEHEGGIITKCNKHAIYHLINRIEDFIKINEGLL